MNLLWVTIILFLIYYLLFSPSSQTKEHISPISRTPECQACRQCMQENYQKLYRSRDIWNCSKGTWGDFIACSKWPVVKFCPSCDHTRFSRCIHAIWEDQYLPPDGNDIMDAIDAYLAQEDSLQEAALSSKITAETQIS